MTGVTLNSDPVEKWLPRSLFLKDWVSILNIKKKILPFLVQLSRRHYCDHGLSVVRR